MKFFIDTAQLEEIKKAASYGVLDGVTTNPSLMAKVGIKGRDAILKHYKAICDVVSDNVSAEVIATDFDGIMKEAHELAAIDKKIVVKVPMIPDGVKAIKALSDEGIRTNCTLVFSVSQAILAAKAGASYVSPFVGRLDDISMDGMQLISDLVTVFDNYAFETEILVASIRNPLHLVASAKLGADVATIPFTVIEQLFKHPLTDSGLAKFLADHEASQK
jgi:transaldolase